jgi:hypothetical protein
MTPKLTFQARHIQGVSYAAPSHALLTLGGRKILVTIRYTVSSFNVRIRGGDRSNHNCASWVEIGKRKR